MIFLRKYEVPVERISVCYVTENLADHGIHCLPWSYTNDIIGTLMCLSIGTPKIINFPFVPNGKFIILGVPKFG